MPQFLVRQRHYTKVYLMSKNSSLQEMGAKKGTWLAELIEFVAAETQRAPVSKPDFYLLSTGLILAKQDRGWLALANVPLTELDISLALKALYQFEVAISASKVTTAIKKSSTSSQLRKWLIKFGVALNIERFSRLNRYFRTSLQRPRYQSRGCLSDVMSGTFPLGATQHETASGLKQQLDARFQTTLITLRSTCIAELDKQSSNAKEFLEIVTNRVTSTFVERIRTLTSGRSRWILTSNHPWVLSADLLDVLAAYYVIVFVPMDNPVEITAVRGREISFMLAERFDIPRRQSISILVLIFEVLYGGLNCAVACALIIQSFTGWNASSVQSLCDSNIKNYGAHMEIQGYKTKTGDYTPPYFIDSHEVDLIRALSFLRTRLNALKNFGLAPKDATDLWLNPRSPNTLIMPWVKWSEALRRFQRKHHLPAFTFEMVRNEVLARVANSKGGIEAARHVGGHNEITTTGHYADQLIVQRRNAAISLKYQQALQASVKYDFEAPSDQRSEADLLYPIGDGSVCKDPFSPPFELSPGEGVCRAIQCHAGGGCPNNRIIINIDRLEELVLFRLIFERTWKKNLEENSERFYKVDLPTWQFNEGLRGVVEKGPYRHYLKRIEQLISEKSK
ncbi:hypothetical protein ABE501_00030 [Comamonas testosteroni]